MTNSTTFSTQAQTLTALLGLANPPLAISFSSEAPSGIARYEAEMPAPTPDGRTGKVPAE